MDDEIRWGGFFETCTLQWEYAYKHKAIAVNVAVHGGMMIVNVPDEYLTSLEIVQRVMNLGELRKVESY